MADVVAVVPLKALDQVKRRLAPVLPAAARRELVGWMLLRVVEACRGAQSVRDVLVVAGDEDGAAMARAAGTDVLLHAEPGLRAALRHADAVLAGVAATLVVAADLPLACAEDIEAVCAAGAGADRVVVVPTIDQGTAALHRRPAGIIAPAYGLRSARRHVLAARAAGVEAVRLELPRLGFDVDLPEDLAALRGWQRDRGRSGTPPGS